VKIIHNWSFQFTTDEYQAPELQKCIVVGEGDWVDAEDDKKYIKTSAVKTFDYQSQIVVTQNNTYQLGKIDPGFRKFMQEEGFVLENYQWPKKNAKQWPPDRNCE